MIPKALDYCSYCCIEAADWLFDRNSLLDRIGNLLWWVGMRFHNGANRLGYYDDDDGWV